MGLPGRERRWRVQQHLSGRVLDGRSVCPGSDPPTRPHPPTHPFPRTEPTNDLDLSTVEVLEEQVKQFRGVLLTVSLAGGAVGSDNARRVWKEARRVMGRWGEPANRGLYSIIGMKRRHTAKPHPAHLTDTGVLLRYNHGWSAPLGANPRFLTTAVSLRLQPAPRTLVDGYGVMFLTCADLHHGR